MAGKTSLIKTAVRELKGFKTMYINLWGVNNTYSLLNSMVEGLNSSKALLEKVKDTIISIEGISIGPGGVSISVSKRPMKTLEGFLSAIGRQGSPCLIEFDEVQELAPISGPLLKLLANIFNTYSNIIFVFSGSMFGVMRTLLEPTSHSPLYGRSPAKLLLKPFGKDLAREFLKKGFEEQGLRAGEEEINEVVERLDGLPGWLTLYGNCAAVRKLPHREALEETISEGVKIVRSELNHFLEGKDRESYIAALKALAFSARWSEIKRAIELSRGISVNDGSVHNIMERLQAAMLVQKENGYYKVKDPMLRAYLLG